jgi:hypothetical protein
MDKKKVTLKCEACGYTKEVFMDEIYAHQECELCGGRMSYLDDFADNYIIERLQDNIRQLGHERTWYNIESINKADSRVRYRKYFFEAGGAMPEKT